MEYKLTLEEARELDNQDPLKEYRSKFLFPKNENGEALLYFTGNSLGLQPITTRAYIEEDLEEWSKWGVEGHSNAKRPWMPYHEFVTDSLAKIVGAKPHEVVAMNSLTINLHLMMVSFYRPSGSRRKILIESNAFPSDIYSVKSQIEFHGGDPNTDLIILKESEGLAYHKTEDILEVIDKNKDELALVMLGGVNYYTGQAFDMKAITKKAHEHGIIAGFDLAHGAGNLHLKLHDWNVDFAVWCSYKYMNAGPGAIAGCFVHDNHASEELPRFAGWWGHEKETRFLMGPDFIPIKGAESWQMSNPPIFQLAALRGSLDLFDQVGMEKLRAKSEKLTGYFETLLHNINSDRIEVITPSDPKQRGCQLSIRVIGADKSLFNKVSEQDVVADWREPDVIRTAPVPFYNSYEDVFRFYEILKNLVED